MCFSGKQLKVLDNLSAVRLYFMEVIKFQIETELGKYSSLAFLIPDFPFITKFSLHNQNEQKIYLPLKWRVKMIHDFRKSGRGNMCVSDFQLSGDTRYGEEKLKLNQIDLIQRESFE